jgi:hypothetical protein
MAQARQGDIKLKQKPEKIIKKSLKNIYSDC